MATETQPTIRTEWNADNPPMDGTLIVAVGRIIYSDEFSTTVDPFCALIYWKKAESGYEGWMYKRADGYDLSVARELDDKVKIDFWMPYPQ